jgi:curved DNA-binding protein CbpA
MLGAEPSMQRPRSPYEVLNVSPDAEPEVIEAAYKVLMKKYHPDKLAGGPPLSESKAAELNDAFKILRHPGRRARHDADEKARRPVTGGADWTFDGSRGGVPFAPRSAVPPPRPAPPPRRNTGRLIAGWTAIVAAVAAIGLAYAATRQASSNGLGAGIRAAADEMADTAAGDRRPVSERRIDEALVKFERVRALYGSAGVAAYSDACFDAQRRTRDLDDFDFCVAFDHAASAFDGTTQEPFQVFPPRFSEAQLASRHSGAAKLQPQDYEALEDRMNDIRTLTYGAIADKAEEPAPAATPPKAAAAPRPQPRRTAATPPRPSARAQRPQQEADFLEREGGIY